MEKLSHLVKSLSDEERERILHKAKDCIIKEINENNEKGND